VLPQQSVDNIAFDIQDIRDNMPFLISLSNKDRQFNFKLSSKRTAFVATVIDAAKVEPLTVPSWVDVNAMKNDFELYQQLFGIENLLESLLLDVKDTKTRVGIEALKSATDIYAHVQAGKKRVPELSAIYETLKKVYPGRGKAKEKPKKE
jgi:hypothetical protein